MTAPRRRVAAPGAHHVRMAAAVEARSAGELVVDVDHVLLGLSVVGGPSAWALARAGADLPSLRRAVAQVRATGPGAWAGSHRSTIDAAARREAVRVPVTERTRSVFEATPPLRDDRALLLVLIDEHEQIGRLLGRLGVDVLALRNGLADPTAVAGPDAEDAVTWPGLRLPDPGPPGSSWSQVDRHRSFPVPAGRVWSLISDPLRRPEWDHRYVGVATGDDGPDHLSRADGGIDTQGVLDVVDGYAIAWSRHDRSRAEAGTRAAGDVLQVVLAPVDGGTAIGLRRHLSGRGTLWRLTRSLAMRATRMELEILAHAIHQAAAAR